MEETKPRNDFFKAQGKKSTERLFHVLRKKEDLQRNINSEVQWLSRLSTRLAKVLGRNERLQTRMASLKKVGDRSIIDGLLTVNTRMAELFALNEDLRLELTALKESSTQSHVDLWKSTMSGKQRVNRSNRQTLQRTTQCLVRKNPSNGNKLIAGRMKTNDLPKSMNVREIQCTPRSSLPMTARLRKAFLRTGKPTNSIRKVYVRSLLLSQRRRP